MTERIMAKVVSLHASPERGFPRPMVDKVELVVGYGIVGDRKAGKREARAVLLIGLATYEHLEGIGKPLPFGGLGENLVLDVDPHSLEPGTALQIGQAVLEISLYCSACKTLRDRYGSDFPLLLGRRRGMLARVIRGGLIAVGDSLQIPSNSPLIQPIDAKIDP